MKTRKEATFRVFFYLYIFLCVFLCGCVEQSDLKGYGILKGKITIGPLCPVETDPPLPGCQPTSETYKAWQTSVWNLNKTKIIADIEPELDGTFSMKLLSGKYIIDYKENSNNSIGGNNLPIDITIENIDTTTIEINIDTGIR